jgi:3-methylcrotonyl-CoA carboxylase alpha subunit
MEMNTRLQVEHPVTEAITGLDLVEWQLRVAAGEALSFEQADLKITGHAVEARVYAENPSNKFLPSTGKLLHVNFSDQARVDTGVVTGNTVSVHYDPMLAKLTAWGATRAAAIAQLKHALKESELVGVEHNIPYLVNVLEHDNFLDGSYTTALADLYHDQFTALDVQLHLVAAVLWLSEMGKGKVWDNADGFRINLPARRRLVLALAKDTFECHYDGTGVVISPLEVVGGGGEATRVGKVVASLNSVEFVVKSELVRAHIVSQATSTDSLLYVIIDGATKKINHLQLDQQSFETDVGYGDQITSPMPGQVVSVLVKEGDRVATGESLLVVEAMKMEHAIVAPKSGVVETINCAAGARVEEDLELIVMQYDD